MKPLLLTLILTQGAGEECPASLTLTRQNAIVAAHAQPYARCMAFPSLPSRNQAAARRARCATERSQALAIRRGLRGAAGDAVAWIDHVAANNPDCETTLLLSIGTGR